MEYSAVQLNDLPDEILLVILKNLIKIDVLYSCIGVNKRIDRIVHHSIFTSSLTLFDYLWSGHIYPLPNLILERFCSQILPKIHQKIEWLDLEPLSMEHILLSAKYPNLFGMGIYNIEKATALKLFTDKTAAIHRLKNQILSLVVGTINVYNSLVDNDTLMFSNILNSFINLECLNLVPSDACDQLVSFCHRSLNIFSLTLLELRIKVLDMEDCLYLLDGRLNQLRRFHVYVALSSSLSISEINKENLPNLRCFTLYCLSRTFMYDNVILPLLHRMSNLQALSLYLSTSRRNKFIDGNNLKENIIDYLPRLNQFEFNIRSCISIEDQAYLPSNEAIKHSLKNISNSRIICCVDYFFERDKGECHIYTYPYRMTFYENITNNFPGGLFTCVSHVVLYDQNPFEHEFFIRITQSFPFMEHLSILNRRAQNNKQRRKFERNNVARLVIEYLHLRYLDLNEAHDDYVEQFLLDSKTSLPYGVELHIDYKQLKRVTHNFTRKKTRINCAKIIYKCSNRIFQFPKHFDEYFLNVHIL